MGDVVKVMKGEFFPSDLLFLASEDKISASAYVDTCNLDGETTLKTYLACGISKSSAAFNDESNMLQALKALNIGIFLHSFL